MAETPQPLKREDDDLVDPKTGAPLENEPDSSGIGSHDTTGTGVRPDQAQGGEFDDPSGGTGVRKPTDSMTKPEMGE